MINHIYIPYIKFNLNSEIAYWKDILMTTESILRWTKFSSHHRFAGDDLLIARHWRHTNFSVLGFYWMLGETVVYYWLLYCTPPVLGHFQSLLFLLFTDEFFGFKKEYICLQPEERTADHGMMASRFVSSILFLRKNIGFIQKNVLTNISLARHFSHLTKEEVCQFALHKNC